MEFGHMNRKNKLISEKDFPKATVETAGFRTTAQRVEEYLRAGEMLRDHRRAMYDAASDDDIESIQLDPTRDPNYDISDADNRLNELEERIGEAQSKRQKAKLEEEKAALKAELLKEISEGVKDEPDLSAASGTAEQGSSGEKSGDIQPLD